MPLDFISLRREIKSLIFKQKTALRRGAGPKANKIKQEVKKLV